MGREQDRALAPSLISLNCSVVMVVAFTFHKRGWVSQGYIIRNVGLSLALDLCSPTLHRFSLPFPLGEIAIERGCYRVEHGAGWVSRNSGLPYPVSLEMLLITKNVVLQLRIFLSTSRSVCV